MARDNKNKKKKQKKAESWSFPDISNVASTGEMTGMIPTPPQNQDEYENYQDLHSMPIPKKKGNKLERK